MPGDEPQPDLSSTNQQGRLALCLQSLVVGAGTMVLLAIGTARALELGASVQEAPRQEPFGAEA